MDISIRPLREEDAMISYKWRNDPDVFKYTGAHYDHEISLDDEISWIRKIVKNEKDYRCAIIANGVYIGNIYLTDIENGIATYHIFIGNKRYWGKGVATEASKLIIDYGFKKLRLNEIRLKVKHNNIRAYHLYLKLGFKEYEKDPIWFSMKLINNVANYESVNPVLFV